MSDGYKPGYIYVLRSGPYYKIGYASDVEQRMKTVHTAVAPDLTERPTLLFYFPTRSKRIAEETLHSFFQGYHVKGEWFKLEDRHIIMLRRFTEDSSVDEFATQLLRLPSNVALWSDEEVDFCQRFGIRVADSGSDAPADAVRQERARQATLDRQSKYKKHIIRLVDEMLVEDMEWLFEQLMTHGIAPKED